VPVLHCSLAKKNWIKIRLASIKTLDYQLNRFYAEPFLFKRPRVFYRTSDVADCKTSHVLTPNFKMKFWKKNKAKEISLYVSKGIILKGNLEKITFPPLFLKKSPNIFWKVLNYKKSFICTPTLIRGILARNLTLYILNRGWLERKETSLIHFKWSSVWIVTSKKKSIFYLFSKIVKVLGEKSTGGLIKICRVAVISAKIHKRQRRKRQSVTAKREKSQTPKVLTAILT